MGPGETFAALGAAGVLIALLLSGVEMFKRFITYKEAKLSAIGNRALEERVKVLERIVTERGFDVAAQIEALRDRPADNGVALPLIQKETV